MTILDFIAGAAFVMGLVALPFSFYCFRRHTIRSILVFGVPALIFFCACDTSQEIAQTKVLEKLNALSGNYQISINAKSAAHTNAVLSALKTLDWLPDHHSSPTKRITVEISYDSQHVTLWLDRDSGNPREYWVFYPKHYITRYNEIGKL